jgi:hypothetical protein
LDVVERMKKEPAWDDLARRVGNAARIESAGEARAAA